VKGSHITANASDMTSDMTSYYHNGPAQSGDIIPVVVCAADDQYSMPLAVMLRSLSENAINTPSVSVYILDGGVSRRNRRRVEASVSGGRLEIHWIPTNDVLLSDMPVFGHVSICTYYRLLIPRLLPESVSYVLYLDVDILVTGDVCDLWALCNRSHSLAAVPQPNESLGTAANGRRLFTHVPDPISKKYFNAGVLGINLERWRAVRIAERVIKFLADFRDDVRMWDQDGLNACLWADWAALPYCWNTRVDLTDPVSIPSEAVAVNGILHFASACKPWHHGVKHPVVDLYFETVDRTAWKGWRPRLPLRYVIRRMLLNRHYYGALIRQVPGIGGLCLRHRGK
jgi:lipopolysaccharide biosynthesis glycosyltransferase